jgi:hypothetical protein
MQWSASSGDADESSAQCADEIGMAAVGARMHIGSLTCRGRGRGTVAVAARFPPPDPITSAQYPNGRKVDYSQRTTRPLG